MQILPGSQERSACIEKGIFLGKIFEIAKNSLVSSVVERLKREMIRDKKIKKRVEILRGKLTKSQE